MRLPQLVKNPAPILPILTALMDDPEDYVRRSVANSLNDVAKDHPDLVAAFIASHIDGASSERRWLLKHASRTLLKKGHAQALANFGFAAAASLECELRLRNAEVMFGEGLDFEILVTNAGERAQSLMIDYAIHHDDDERVLQNDVGQVERPEENATGRELEEHHADLTAARRQSTTITLRRPQGRRSFHMHSPD